MTLHLADLWALGYAQSTPCCTIPRLEVKTYRSGWFVILVTAIESQSQSVVLDVNIALTRSALYLPSLHLYTAYWVYHDWAIELLARTLKCHPFPQSTETCQCT